MSFSATLKRALALTAPKAAPKKRKAKRAPRVVAPAATPPEAPGRISPIALFPVEPAPVVKRESDEARILRVVAEAQAQQSPAPVPTSAPVATRRQCEIVDPSVNRRCCLLSGHDGLHRHNRGEFRFSTIAPKRDLELQAWRSA